MSLSQGLGTSGNADNTDWQNFASLLEAGHLRVGMLHNPGNIVSNGFMPGAIIQPLLEYVRFEDGKTVAALDQLAQIRFQDDGPIKMKPLHYCDGMLMKEHQSLSMLLSLGQGVPECVVSSRYGEGWLVISGELAFNVNGHERKIGAGELLLVPPKSTFSAVPVADSYAIMFNSEMAGREFVGAVTASDIAPTSCKIGEWVDLSAGNPALVRSSTLNQNWVSTDVGIDYAEIGSGALLVRADRQTSFSYEAPHPKSLACMVLDGAMAFEREVLPAGTFLHLPCDRARFDFGLKADSLLLLAGAPV